MRIGIYPGSFDPLTNGHIDIIERAGQLCDKLIIAVAKNTSKNPLFSMEERLEMLEICCSGHNSQLEIVAFEGLLVEFCRGRNVSFIIRGLRALVDFDYEYAIALMNRKLAPEVETVFLMARSEYSFVSSNIVKEVAYFGGDISTLIPQYVHKKLQEKLSRKN